MKRLLLASLLVTGCAASNPPEGLAPTSVHDALSAAAPTRMLVTVAASSGSLTASHYTHDGWQDGSLDVSLANGELDAHLRADGSLALSAFSVNVNPIDIPASVFGKPAQLTNVRLVLAGDPPVTTTWVDENDAIATATVTLDLSWTIVVDGHAAPLGTQHLAPLPFDLSLTGTGEAVDAAIALHASGDLWTWANLLKLTALDLELSATSAY